MLKNELDMCFNYVPIYFGEVKEGCGEKPPCYELLCKAQHGDQRLADIIIRLGGKESRFNEKIVWDDMVALTIHSHGFYRGNDKTKLTDEDYRNCSTFPRDFNWNGEKVSYVCGMSVPPIMIKRIVTRLIENGVFKQD